MIRIALSACALVVLLQGCAVSPEPLTEAEVNGLVNDASQRWPNAVDYSGLDLSKVVEKAVANSPDLRSQRIAKLVALQNADFTNQQVLIAAMLNIGYGVQPSDNNQDYRITKSNFVFYWNALDFGISYLRAKTSANAALISQEEERRQTSLLVSDVIKYWYLAKFYAENGARISSLKKLANSYYGSGKSGAEATSGGLSPDDYAALADGMYWLIQQEDDFKSSQYALNKAVGAQLEYKPRKFGLDDLSVPAASYEIDTLIKQSVQRRPEVRNSIYEGRNQKLADQINFLYLLPLPRLTAGTDFRLGQGDFLTGSWVVASAQLVGNLANLVAVPSARELSKKKTVLAASRLIAVARMVQLQVGLAYIDVQVCREKTLWAKRNWEQRSAVVEKASTSPGREKAEFQQVVGEMRNISAELRYTQSLIDYKVALIKLSSSAGYDQYTDGTSSLGPDDLGQPIN